MLSSRVSNRLGSIRTMTVAFGLAVPFYLLIPLAPSFAWLSPFYVMQFCFATLAVPLLSSTLMKDLGD